MKKTVEVTAEHTPFDTDHTKELVPVLIAVTGDKGFEGDCTLPVPDKRDQTPIPSVGFVADNVAVEEQIFCVRPAFEEIL